MNSAKALYKEIIIPPFLNPSSINDLLNQITSFETENIRFLVLKGTKAIFCDGLDLTWVAKNEKGNYMKEMREYGAFLKKIQTGPFISIALVNGSVSGGGMGIVCACDYVIADEKSNFSLPEGLLGLIPGMIMPALLNRLSPQRIKKMVFTGQKHESNLASEWGIADEVVQSDALESALTEAMNKMKSCRKEPIGDLKQLLYTSHINKDELAQLGMNILSDKLSIPEINQRLKSLAEFMADD